MLAVLQAEKNAGVEPRVTSFEENKNKKPKSINLTFHNNSKEKIYSTKQAVEM